MKLMCVPTIALLMLLASCAAPAKKVTSDQLAQFTVGQTTEADVLRVLGTPSSTIKMPDGQRVDSYSHSRNVGLLAAPETSSAMLFFSADGKLTQTSISGDQDPKTPSLLGD